jgi:hypothetical protein
VAFYHTDLGLSRFACLHRWNELLLRLFDRSQRHCFVLVQRCDGGLHIVDCRVDRIAMRAERSRTPLERDPERANHLRQQPRVVNVVLVVGDDAGGAANRKAAPAVVLGSFVVKLATIAAHSTVVKFGSATSSESVLVDGLEWVLLERFDCQVERNAPATEERVARWAPVGGIGRAGLVVTLVTLWRWTRPTLRRHICEHHAVGQERGGTRGKRVPTAGNRAPAHTWWRHSSRCNPPTTHLFI